MQHARVNFQKSICVEDFSESWWCKYESNKRKIKNLTINIKKLLTSIKSCVNIDSWTERSSVKDHMIDENYKYYLRRLKKWTMRN